MPAAPPSLAALRQLLAARFPSATRTPGRTLPTGIAALDDVAGGLPLGAVTELVCSAPSCGGQLAFAQLLAHTRAARQRLALVDSADEFDPASYAPDLLVHLVWVRARGTTEALAAADLLVRDANLALTVLDLRAAPEAELRRVPAPTWFRFQRAVESGELALLVLTSRPLVASAQLRLVLEQPLPSSALAATRPASLAHLLPAVQRQRTLATAGAAVG